VKEMSELYLPEDVRYAEEHEWARIEGNTVRIGVSDYAQDQLGDITFVELPAAGDTFKKGDEFGTLESTKAVSELYIPLGGEVVKVNVALVEAPGVINTDPYGDGWLIVIKPDNRSEMDELMTAEEYGEFLGGLD
jgi:glycine cleavage system H protein